jgi:MFS family permease
MATTGSARAPAFRWRDLPRTVVVLGLVSLLMDSSSELIHSLLPVFLVSALGASAATVGIIEGLSEATAAVGKVFSGVVSDWMGRRKLLVALGYGLAGASKILFPIATSPATVLLARFVDRCGKGLRDAPRDALIADVTPSNLRGSAYGLRQALDTVGAVIGPLAALALMVVLADNFRAVFWWALIPAALAVLLVVFGVREPERSAGRGGAVRLRLSDLPRLPAAYWWIVLIGSVFTLAQFSEAFLVLRANASGLPVALSPLVLVCMNVVYAAVAAPAGALSDRMGRRGLLLDGMIVNAVGNLTLALFPSLPAVFIGIAILGGYLGLIAGLLSALVADTAPPDRRGTAFGVFNLISGLILLIASTLAGELWDHFGPTATFGAGAVFAAVAAGLLALTRRDLVRVQAADHMPR